MGWLHSPLPLPLLNYRQTKTVQKIGIIIQNTSCLLIGPIEIQPGKSLFMGEIQ